MTRNLLVTLLILVLVLPLGCEKPTPQPTTKPTQGVTSTPRHNLVKITPPEGIEYQTINVKPSAGQYVKDGTLTVATVSDPQTFNYYQASGTSSTQPLSFMFEGLVDQDPETMETTPSLAKEWTVSKDGLVWTFKLRKVKWSDGHPFTADDVVFTFNDIIYNPDIFSSSKDLLTIDGKQVKVEKIDDYTVRFTLPKVFSLFKDAVGTLIMPKHILEKSVKEKKFSSTWGVNSKASEIVCNGPFILQEYVPGQRMVMARNPNYWKKDHKGQQLPYLFRLVWINVPNSDTAILKFKAGETDVCGISANDYALFQSLAKKQDFSLYQVGPSFGITFLTFNLMPGKNKEGSYYIDPVKYRWFTNKKFRQALAHAIDRPSIKRLIYNDFAVFENSPIPVPNKLFYAETKVYDYNVEKAKQFLKEAGFYWKNNKLYDDKGNRVEFTILTNIEATVWVQEMVLIASDFKKLGMDITTSAMQFNAFIQRRDSAHQWETCVGALTGGTEPAFGKNVWLSSGKLHFWNPKQDKPATEWEAEINKLFEESTTTFDVARRKAIFKRFQEIIMEEVPLIPLVNPLGILAVRNHFGNVKPNPIGTTSGRRSSVLYNIEELYIK